MKDRKMVAVGEREHSMLRELAEYYNRSMTKQVEWLIEMSYLNINVPNVPYPTLIKPGVQEEE